MASKYDSNKKHKMKNRGSDPPQTYPDLSSDDDKNLVSKLLDEAIAAYRMPRVKNDEELKKRFNDYFSGCAVTGQTPTMEEMYMSTGYSISTCHDWMSGRRKGFSPETAKIVKRAKDFMQTFDAKLVVAGKLNFLAYCFRSKNYYGMTDKQDIVFAQGVDTGAEYSLADIRARYQLPQGDTTMDATMDTTATVTDERDCGATMPHDYDTTIKGTGDGTGGEAISDGAETTK